MDLRVGQPPKAPPSNMARAVLVAVLVLTAVALNGTSVEASNLITAHECDQADPGATYINNGTVENGGCISNAERGVPGNFSAMTWCVNETHYAQYAFFGDACFGPWIQYIELPANICLNLILANYSIVCNATTPMNATEPIFEPLKNEVILVEQCNGSGTNASYVGNAIARNQYGCISSQEGTQFAGVSGQFTCYNDTHYILHTFNNENCTPPCSQELFQEANTCVDFFGTGWLDTRCPPVGPSEAVITVNQCNASGVNASYVNTTTHTQGSCVTSEDAIQYAGFSWTVHCYNATHHTIIMYTGDSCEGDAVLHQISASNVCEERLTGYESVTCPPVFVDAPVPPPKDKKSVDLLGAGWVVLISVGAAAGLLALAGGVTYLMSANVVKVEGPNGAGSAYVAYSRFSRVGDLQRQASSAFGEPVQLQRGGVFLRPESKVGDVSLSERDRLLAYPNRAATLRSRGGRP